MTADQRDASDAVYVLKAIARLIRNSPHKEDAGDDWAEMHAGYLEDIAGAVIRDAQLDAEQVAAGERYVGNEWEGALIPILFGFEDQKSVVQKLRSSSAPAPTPDPDLR